MKIIYVHDINENSWHDNHDVIVHTDYNEANQYNILHEDANEANENDLHEDNDDSHFTFGFEGLLGFFPGFLPKMVMIKLKYYFNFVIYMMYQHTKN